MEHRYIEEIEEKAIQLRKALQTFNALLSVEDRSPRDFNHLGTLSVNLEVLRIVAKDTRNLIGY